MISKSRTVIRICIAIFVCSFLITILGCPCNCNFELYKYTGVIISNFPEWLSKYKYVNKFSEWKEWDSEHNLKSLFLDKYDKFDYKGMYRLIVEGQILGIEFDNGDSYVFMFSWLKPYESNKDINFVGNMEAREMFSGDFDVLVCDGLRSDILGHLYQCRDIRRRCAATSANYPHSHISHLLNIFSELFGFNKKYCLAVFYLWKTCIWLYHKRHSGICQHSLYQWQNFFWS